MIQKPYYSYALTLVSRASLAFLSVRIPLLSSRLHRDRHSVCPTPLTCLCLQSLLYTSHSWRNRKRVISPRINHNTSFLNVIWTFTLMGFGNNLSNFDSPCPTGPLCSFRYEWWEADSRPEVSAAKGNSHRPHCWKPCGHHIPQTKPVPLEERSPVTLLQESQDKSLIISFSF